MSRRIIVLFLTVLLLVGCTQPAKAPATGPAATTTAATPPASSDTASTTQPTETTESTAAPTETTAVTEPAHSELYLSDVSADDIVRYFCEVCLDAEFVHSGNASVLQRWESPINYYIHGSPTDEDLEVIVNFVQWLNSLQGFPGIFEAEEPWQANLAIHFCTQPELVDIMGDQYHGLDGAVTFWYSEDIIYDAVICIRTDLDQYLRNSVILEEIYNGLGPIQDTALRPDSIIYSEFTQPQALTPVDELILKLLYHPDLACGMNAADCEAIIRSLYY